VASAPRQASSRWLRLGVWALVVVALAVLGTGIAKHLTPSTLLVPGTPSARAEAMLEHRFGDSVAVTVLLRGPAVEVDRQGPRLVAAFRRERRVRVMSPWDADGAPASLRPRPGAALVVVDFERSDSVALTEVVPGAQRIVNETVRPPLRADVGGLAAIGLALQEDALAATHRAELLVAPILVLEMFEVLREINRRGVSILLIEQNAVQALQLSHRGYVLVMGATRFEDTGANLLANREVGEAFLGGRAADG